MYADELKAKAGMTVEVIGNMSNTCQPIGWTSKVLWADGEFVTIVGTSGMITMKQKHVKIVEGLFPGLCELE